MTRSLRNSRQNVHPLFCQSGNSRLFRVVVGKDVLTHFLDKIHNIIRGDSWYDFIHFPLQNYRKPRFHPPLSCAIPVYSAGRCGERALPSARPLVLVRHSELEIIAGPRTTEGAAVVSQSVASVRPSVSESSLSCSVLGVRLRLRVAGCALSSSLFCLHCQSPSAVQALLAAPLKPPQHRQRCCCRCRRRRRGGNATASAVRRVVACVVVSEQ